MNLKTFLRLLRRLPVAYQTAVFVTGRRVIVRGESMVPTLLPGERVLFDTLVYRIEEPQPGEVVLARHAKRPGITMIKRVVAVPGDRTDGQLLGEGEYWLEGDSPEFSTDSRDLGAFQRKDILGRAWLVYWPLDSFRRM